MGKEVPYPNTIEHHIKWIALFGVKNDVAVHVATVELELTFGVPTVAVDANLGDFSGLVAVEYCNIHGLWESSQSL